MKKFLSVLFALIISGTAFAKVLTAGVSVESVPRELYGSWSVKGILEETNSAQRFKPQSMDSWTLSRKGDIITLNNPISGARAQISIETVENNVIVFSKKMDYDNNKTLTDTVRIRLEGNTFSGINTLKLETFSLVDRHLMKTETALYRISGEKVAGDSVLFQK